MIELRTEEEIIDDRLEEADLDEDKAWRTLPSSRKVKYQCYCRECGKEVRWRGYASLLIRFLKGALDNEEAFGDTLDNEEAFLIATKICVDCNGGFGNKELEQEVDYEEIQ